LVVDFDKLTDFQGLFLPTSLDPSNNEDFP
jgi:hypothetical protein